MGELKKVGQTSTNTPSVIQQTQQPAVQTTSEPTADDADRLQQLIGGGVIATLVPWGFFRRMGSSAEEFVSGMFDRATRSFQNFMGELGRAYDGVDERGEPLYNDPDKRAHIPKGQLPSVTLDSSNTFVRNFKTLQDARQAIANDPDNVNATSVDYILEDGQRVTVLTLRISASSTYGVHYVFGRVQEQGIAITDEHNDPYYGDFLATSTVKYVPVGTEERPDLYRGENIIDGFVPNPHGLSALFSAKRRPMDSATPGIADALGITDTPPVHDLNDTLIPSIRGALGGLAYASDPQLTEEQLVERVAIAWLELTDDARRDFQDPEAPNTVSERWMREVFLPTLLEVSERGGTVDAVEGRSNESDSTREQPETDALRQSAEKGLSSLALVPDPAQRSELVDRIVTAWKGLSPRERNDLLAKERSSAILRNASPTGGLIPHGFVTDFLATQLAGSQRAVTGTVGVRRDRDDRDRATERLGEVLLDSLRKGGGK